MDFLRNPSQIVTLYCPIHQLPPAPRTQPDSTTAGAAPTVVVDPPPHYFPPSNRVYIVEDLNSSASRELPLTVTTAPYSPAQSSLFQG